MEHFMTDLETWYFDEGMDNFYKILIYKKVWTPYEIDKKFSDESAFEDGGYYKIVRILGIIELPNKDVLFKFQEYAKDYLEDEPSCFKKCGSPFFEKLSDIKLYEVDFDDEPDEE